MTVPFLDLRAAYLELKSDIDRAVASVLDGGQYILGAEVERFEDEFASYCNVDYAVGVGNGLDALILALRALGIGEGDEVIVPSNTFIASWLAISMVGAVPVAVEPHLATCNIDAAKISERISSRTKAIMPVHLYGQPADVDPIVELARCCGLAIIEDAAQAHGARYKRQNIGGHGDIACWSFYPGKNLGALGDGGAVTTNRLDLAERVRILRNYGSQKKYFHQVRGVNSRLDPIQAAVLRIKLRRLDEWNERRRCAAAKYLEALRGTRLHLPDVPDWAEPSWHLFVVRSEEREQLRSRLAAAGVETLIHYPLPPHRQEAYADSEIGSDTLPVADRLAATVLSLPMGPHLSADDQSRVIDALLSEVAII